MNTPRLFCFGLGYSARVLAAKLAAKGWEIAGTCREAESAEGFKVFPFDGAHPVENITAALEGASHILSSVPPDGEGDPVLRHHAGDIAALTGLEWSGYLSSTGVYGDTGGAKVDETAPLAPTSERSRWRAAAEKEWLALDGPAAHVFRLSGIYGPGSSVLERVRDGVARRIHKPGHLFSRIHVEDIANVVIASMEHPNPGAVYNVADDEPASAAEVIAFACRLLNVEPPELVPFDEAGKTMSPMALSFWRDNRLVDNTRIKKELGVKLTYPDYRSGLTGIVTK